MAQVVGESYAARWSIAEFDQLFDSLNNCGRWGADDVKEAQNYMTPEHVRHAGLAVRSGRSFSMSLPVNKIAGPTTSTSPSTTWPPAMARSPARR